jgi:hypothetical protein
MHEQETRCDYLMIKYEYIFIIKFLLIVLSFHFFLRQPSNVRLQHPVAPQLGVLC